jgi:carbamoyl-phosphate synthase small subunit
LYEPEIVAYDFGIKHNILGRLASYGCKTTVVPSTWPASETLRIQMGFFLAMAPETLLRFLYAVQTVKEILGKVPVFGI